MRVCLLFIYLGFTTYFSTSIAQQFDSDSLGVIVLLKSVKLANVKNLDDAELVANKALCIAENIENLNLTARAHRSLSIILGEKGGKYNSLQSLEHLKVCKEIFDELKDTLGIIGTLNNMSIVQRQLSRYPEAITSVYTSISYAEHLKDNRDNYLARSYGVLGNIYRNINLKDSAVANFSKARQFFEKLGSVYQFHCDLNTGVVYFREGELEKAKPYFFKAYSGFENRNDSIYLATSANEIAKLYLKEDSLRLANQYFTIALGISEKKMLPRQLSRALTGKSKVYYHKKEHKKALALVERSEKLNDSFGFAHLKSSTYEVKAKILTETGNAKEGMMYLEMSTHVYDSLAAAKNYPQIANSLIKVREESDAFLMQQYSTSNSNKSKVIALLIFMTISVGAFSFVSFRKYKTEIANREKKQRALLESFLTVKKTKEKVDRKLTSVSMHLANKTDLLNKIQELLNATNIEDNVKEIRQEINNQNVIDKAWNDFFLHFEAVNPEFFKNIQSKNRLTQNDLKICAYIKMNLSSKDIATLLNVSPNSIRITFHRLKKKIGLSKEENLFEHIKNI